MNRSEFVKLLGFGAANLMIPNVVSDYFKIVDKDTSNGFLASYNITAKQGGIVGIIRGFLKDIDEDMHALFEHDKNNYFLKVRSQGIKRGIEIEGKIIYNSPNINLEPKKIVSYVRNNVLSELSINNNYANYIIKGEDEKNIYFDEASYDLISALLMVNSYKRDVNVININNDDKGTILESSLLKMKNEDDKQSIYLQDSNFWNTSNNSLTINGSVNYNGLKIPKEIVMDKLYINRFYNLSNIKSRMTSFELL